MSFLLRRNNTDSQQNDMIYIVITKQDHNIELLNNNLMIKGVYNYYPTFYEFNNDVEIIGPYHVQKKSQFNTQIPPRRLSSIESEKFESDDKKY